LKVDQGDAVQQALRPYATAGVAIVTASLIAATPMAMTPRDVATFRDVKLTSGGADLTSGGADLTSGGADLTPWIDQFNAASENATTLLNNFYDGPFIGLQQMIANQSGFLQDFFNDPTSSTVTSISGEMQVNLASVLTGFALQGASNDVVSEVIRHTLNNGSDGGSGHIFLFQELPSFLPSSINPAEIQPIVDFLASPESGIIMGDLGPFISPLVALGNSISAGDSFNEILANTYGAFFNGADLSLNSLIPLIDEAGIFPQGYNLENLEIAFGGLLTPGSVVDGPNEVGGSIFNSLGLELTGVPVLGTLDVTGEPVGPIAAWESWGQTIAALLGWDGSGSPLADVTLPTIPTDFFDAGASGSTAAADLSGLMQDFVSALGL
jgi:hypothetical protein